ncbi:MAG: hypothetical protein GF320_10465, partial [Armatimonadia bacterium]|nr:hypothetical protein [Armatimonadia bacterium]
MTKARPLLTAALVLAGCTIGLTGCPSQEPPASPPPPAPAEAPEASPAETASSEPEVTRVEPMVALEEPGPATLDVEPEDEDTSRFTITEESGQVHEGSVTTEDEVSAEDLGIPVPDSASRISGARVDNIQSDNPMLGSAATGALGIVYETEDSPGDVVAFYLDHESGRFSELAHPLVAQSHMKLVSDSEQGYFIGITESDEGT